MSQDIDAALRGWEFKPGEVQARQVQAEDGRQVLQMRMDLGIVQMETEGRPDGTRPCRSARRASPGTAPAAAQHRFRRAGSRSTGASGPTWSGPVSP